MNKNVVTFSDVDMRENDADFFSDPENFTDDDFVDDVRLCRACGGDGLTDELTTCPECGGAGR